MLNRREEEFRTKFQNVVLRADNVFNFFEKLKTFRLFKSTGILSQRTDAANTGQRDVCWLLV